MTPLMLQDVIVEDLKTLFEGFFLKNSSGEISAMNVFPQNLPAKTTDPGQNKIHFPHIRVILDGGEDPNEVDPNQCNIFLMIGVWDKDPNYQGFRDLNNIIQKIYNSWMRRRVLGGRFEIQYPFRWKIHEEDTFPFFFAGVETTWTVGKITPADTFI